MEESGDCIPFAASLNDVPLEHGHGATIENSVSIFPGAYHWFNSRSQLFNRPEGGRIELIIPPTLNPQVECLANTGGS